MMSLVRFNAVHSGQTAIAKKVYEAVPIAERWNIGQIVGELERIGFRIEYRTVAGCLASLIESGLVEEPSKGKFCREPIREKTAAPPKEETMKSTATPIPPVAISLAPITLAPVSAAAPQKSPIDRLGDLAARVAVMAASLKDLASDISDAALDAEAQFEENAASMAKVKQLHSLLRSFGEQ